MQTKLFITAIFIFSFFISCNRNADKAEASTQAYEIAGQKGTVTDQSGNTELQQIPVGKFSPPVDDSTALPVPGHNTPGTDWDSKIIKTASLKLEISDHKKYNDYVHNTLKLYGAYIAGEEQNLTAERSETTITIKVPVSQFENMMNKLPDNGKVMEKKISTEDVTGEVVDTKARLEAKKQMRLKYLEFLKQSKNMEEVLQVQSEINAIQEQIESAAGRVALLNNQSAMSTINLTFYQPVEGYTPTDVTPSFSARIIAAFRSGAGFVSELFIGLVAIWPLLLAVFIVYLGWKKLRPVKAVIQKS